MLANVDLFLLWALCTYGLYLLIPADKPKGRLWALCVSSLVLIYMLAPWSLLIACGVTTVGFAWCRYHNLYRFRFKRIVALITILTPLVIIKSVGTAQARYSLDITYLAISLGIGFLTLKTIAVVFDNFQQNKQTRFGEFFLLNIFFPIYSAGPIERYDTFLTKQFETRPKFEDFLHGTQRLVLGLFKSVYLAETLIQDFTTATWPNAPKSFDDYSTVSLIGFILFKFLYTYVNFSGYMDVAIGVSRWFGLTVMENFNLPILATNLRNFWQRWHISLGDFVRNYVFFPLLLTFKGRFRAELAIFTSFVLVGLWHEFTLTYLTWGIMHGAGLALVSALDRSKNPVYARVRASPPYRIAAWGITLFYVSFVQTIANLASIGAGFDLFLALLV